MLYYTIVKEQRAFGHCHSPRGLQSVTAAAAVAATQLVNNNTLTLLSG